MPPNDQVKNYNGKPIPEKLYTQLVATHQRLQKKVTGETTLMLTDTWGGLTGNYRPNGGNGVPRQLDLVSYFHACLAREQWNYNNNNN